MESKCKYIKHNIYPDTERAKNMQTAQAWPSSVTKQTAVTKSRERQAACHENKTEDKDKQNTCSNCNKQ